MSRKWLCIILLCFWVNSLFAQGLSDKSFISLLTCSPGEEIYSYYGHTAIRVCDPVNQLDIAFNYGIFDFDTDQFYWKFVRGETYYQLGIEHTNDFVYENIFTNRQVYEQVLNLTLAQRDSLFNALLINYQPENRYYLYNFVFDNCATRPYHLLCQVLGDSVSSDYKGYEGQSYRSFIQYYTGRGSWLDLGINLVFGPKADQPMTSEQRLFLPEELMNYIQQAHLSSGEPLVFGNVTQPFQIAPVPWYKTWYLGAALWIILLIAINIWDRKRGKMTYWVDVVLLVPYLLLLIIVTFLTFFSIHPLVGFGWRLLIIPFVHLCARLIYLIR